MSFFDLKPPTFGAVGWTKQEHFKTFGPGPSGSERTLINNYYLPGSYQVNISLHLTSSSCFTDATITLQTGLGVPVIISLLYYKDITGTITANISGCFYTNGVSPMTLNVVASTTDGSEFTPVNVHLSVIQIA
jgi:hypothetical protein